MLKIRKATEEDLPAITDIYNKAILTTTATFDTTVKTIKEQRRWFRAHKKQNPLLVAELDGTMVGWGSLSQWSDRCAYADTAELSVYVAERHRGKGVGREIMKRLLFEGKKNGLHVVLSRIAEGNQGSIHLHESLGFFHVGVMKEVGVKFGRLLDVFLMEKIL